MMKTHRSSRGRMLAGAAAILALGGISLALGSPGLAQADNQATAQSGEAPAGGAATPQRREERIIIRTNHDGHDNASSHHGTAGTPTERRERVIIMNHDGPGDHAAGAHAMAMNHDGPDGHAIVIPDCPGGQSDEVNEGTDHHRTRIVLCSRGTSATPAARAEQLAHVRERIAGDSDLTAEQKARVTEAIDRQIARLRAQ